MARIIINLSDSLLERLGVEDDNKDVVMEVDELFMRRSRSDEGVVLTGIVGYTVAPDELSESIRDKIGDFDTTAGSLAVELREQIFNWSSPKPNTELHPPEPETPEKKEGTGLYKPDPSNFEVHIPRADGSTEIKKVKELDYYDGGTAQKKLAPDTVFGEDDPRLYEETFIDPETKEKEVCTALTLEVDPIRNEGKRQRVIKLTPVKPK